MGNQKVYCTQDLERISMARRYWPNRMPGIAVFAMLILAYGVVGWLEQ